jgi:hypothetical protein
VVDIVALVHVSLRVYQFSLLSVITPSLAHTHSSITHAITHCPVIIKVVLRTLKYSVVMGDYLEAEGVRFTRREIRYSVTDGIVN